MPKDYRDEYLRFLGRRSISRRRRTLAQKQRSALLDQGFEAIDLFVMWLELKTPDGKNQVFADVFEDEGKARLLWKHTERATMSDAVFVLGKCAEAEVPAYFPFFDCGTNMG